MVKAVILMSGGLDSLLAAKVVLEQGVELEAVNFRTIFCNCTPKSQSCSAANVAVKQLDIPLKVFVMAEDYFEIIKAPKHGYGKNMNPCIDCRIFMFTRAAEYMRETGAQFLVTGEVLGERPMSQRKAAMETIERDANLVGLILRPLSAKLLEPTIPEKEGWVDREKLLSIEGRSRKPQIAMANNYGLRDYPCPAGGCLLTDKDYANRLRDLIGHTPQFILPDAKILKFGRHFRLSEDTKLIVGRNQTENEQIERLSRDGDKVIEPTEIPGPTSVLRGVMTEDVTGLALSITAKYCDGEGKVDLTFRTKGEDGSSSCEVSRLEEHELKRYRI